MDTKTRALVVDDEVHLQESLAEILQEDFSIVKTANDGQQALEVLKSFDADLIITDYKMPGFDGIEFVRRVRANGSNIPIIFLTAHADKEMVIKALRLGAGDMLEKPFQYQSVKQCVHRVLKIAMSNSDLAELEIKYGKDSDEVRRHKRIIGLLQAAFSGTQAS